jgi:TonB family protein
VGDIGEDLPSIGGVNQAPSQCETCSSLQLLSDPQSVDFAPYLRQVLTVVKRNWMRVIPEAAHTGRKGVVLLRFTIDRRGVITGLTIFSPSGTGAFDRAAVTGMSMSNPFPPLPAGYKGDEIRLQMAFSYNVAR